MKLHNINEDIDQILKFFMKFAKFHSVEFCKFHKNCTQMRFIRKSESLPLIFTFLRSSVRFFFIELFNIEAKKLFIFIYCNFNH